MKLIIPILLLCSITFARGGHGGGGGARSYKSSGNTVSVKGYVKKSGKYVPPHRRTKANKTKVDNWSHKGNANPDTGKAGTRE